jgi:hypothetical protein
VICVFDSNRRSCGAGFFAERIDAPGGSRSGRRGGCRLAPRIPSGVARDPPRAVRPIVVALSLAIVVTLALIVVAATRTKQTSIVFRTVPPGTTVEIDGKTATTGSDGTLVVGGLDVGRAYPVTARLDGHTTRQVIVRPQVGDGAVSLELAPLPATVTIESMPARDDRDRRQGRRRDAGDARDPASRNPRRDRVREVRLSGRDHAPRRAGPARSWLVQTLAVSNTRASRDLEPRQARRRRRHAVPSAADTRGGSCRLARIARACRDPTPTTRAPCGDLRHAHRLSPATMSP